MVGTVVCETAGITEMAFFSNLGIIDGIFAQAISVTVQDIDMKFLWYFLIHFPKELCLRYLIYVLVFIL